MRGKQISLYNGDESSSCRSRDGEALGDKELVSNNYKRAVINLEVDRISQADRSVQRDAWRSVLESYMYKRLRL